MTPPRATCRHCETPVHGVVTRGPSDHYFAPCGCRVTTQTVRDFAGADRGRGVAMDGGQQLTEWECGDCGDTVETAEEPMLECLLCGADDWQEVSE